MSVPNVHRLGDLNTGHGCYPPVEIVSASPDVFANGQAVARKDDPYETHCCGPPCHDDAVDDGSSTVYVNGIPMARIGDPVRKGGNCAEGSPDTLAGG